MNTAFFHFHPDFGIFLPRHQRSKVIEKQFTWRASIKDMIESMGVPHAEIELLVVNGESVSFAHIVQPDDQVEVYSRFEAISLPEKVRLRPALLPAQIRFVLDTHLGRLAAYLRMMGFDTLYRNDYPDEELADVSHHENRVLLTRDVGLLKRSIVTYGYFVRETRPKRHLVEVIERFNLAEAVMPFKHCMKCNGLLHRVPKEAVLDEVPADTCQYYEEFHRCQSCQQVYWKGPHYERMQSFISEILSNGQHEPLENP